MGAIKVHWKDFWLGLLGVIPWVVLNIVYWLYKIIVIVTFPIVAPLQLLTPWKEKDHEDAYLWYSGAVDAGIDPGYPDNVYTNRFMIPKAEEIRQKEIDEWLEEKAEKAEKDAEKANK
jgi:hypothetical protein